MGKGRPELSISFSGRPDSRTEVMAFLEFVWEHLFGFISFFWSVFSFWAIWQFCDFCLSRLKVRLKKPWVLDQKNGLDDGNDRS